MKSKYILLSILIISGLFSCKSFEERWVNRLEGNWNITNYLVTEIDSAGTVTTLVDAKDAGSYVFKEATINDLQLEGQLEFTRILTINGNTVTTSGVGTVDEEGKRVIFYGGYCIQCDTFYTIDNDLKDHKVWSRYGPNSNGLTTVHAQYTLDRE